MPFKSCLTIYRSPWVWPQTLSISQPPWGECGSPNTYHIRLGPNPKLFRSSSSFSPLFFKIYALQLCVSLAKSFECRQTLCPTKIALKLMRGHELRGLCGQAQMEGTNLSRQVYFPAEWNLLWYRPQWWTLYAHTLYLFCYWKYKYSLISALQVLFTSTILPLLFLSTSLFLRTVNWDDLSYIHL